MKKSASFLLLFLTAAAMSQETYTTWSYYKVITVNTTASGGGANVGSNRVNYPLLIRLSGPGYADMFNYAAADGSDIRFTLADGVTRRPHQIERWDRTGQSAEIWMYADNILGNDTTNYRIYWGKTGAPDSSNAAATFPIANNFQAVWHMNGGAAGSNETDATVNGFTATQQAGPTSSAGNIGLARTFNGTSQFFSVNGTAGSILNFAANSNYTISAWVNAPNITANRTIVQKSDRQYHLQIDGNGAPNWESVEYNNNAGPTNYGWQSAQSPADATTGWHHVSMVRNGTSQLLYVDGALITTNAGTYIGNGNTPRTENFDVHIGRQAEAAARYWNGTMDEIRIISATRSADHHRLDYETQKAGVTCVTLGATVAQVPPAGLSYTTPVTYGVGVAIAPNNPSVTGVVSSWSVAPVLPAGLTLNTSTGVISGTPTAAAVSTNYTVTATNAAGSTNATVNILVLAAPTGLSYGTNPATYGVGVAIAANNPTVSGTVQSYAVNPALPAGLGINTTTGVITGTPTAASNAANYTVTAQNVAGSTSINLNIRVLAAPTGLSYSANPAIYGVGVAIAANNPTVTGTVQSWSVAPSLPAGLTLSTTTGSITGTPTTPSTAANYTVTAANAGGFTTAILNFTVLSAPTSLSYSQNPVVYPVNAAITPNNPTVTGTVQSYSVTPSLPTGLLLNTTTGIISGTPTVGSTAQNYTITAQNAAGNTTALLNLAVLAPPANLTYSQNPATYGLGVAIAQNNPTVTGTVSGYSVAPPLPTGLSLNPATGAITGTPTIASAAANYTVTAQNAVGQTTADVNITVLTAPSGLSYSQNPVVYPVNVAIAPNNPTVTGTVTGFSVTPGLPAGLALNPTSGVITGTPTIGVAAQNYTVTATNVAGSTTASLNLTVLAAPSGLSYALNPALYGVGVAIAANNPTVTGTVSGYSVSPALPAGLSLDTVSGVITGTPSNAAAAAVYTITAQNAAGSTTASLNLAVLAPPSNLAYSANPVVYRLGAAIAANTPTVTGTVTGYSVTPGLPAGLVLSTTTGIISGTPTAAAAAQNYTVTAANVAGSTQALVNIAVLLAPSNLTYATNPAVYAINAAITPNAPTVTGTVTNYTVTPALPAGFTLDSITGVIAGTPTANAAAQNYAVTASNLVGSTTVNLNLTVITPSSNFSYSSNPAVYALNQAITPNTPTVTGTVINYSVVPALPAGLNLNPNSGVITGTPTAARAAQNYTVTASTAIDSTTVLLNIAVLSAPSNLTYSLNPATYGAGTPITNNIPSVTGNVTNYSVAPALPAGLALNPVTGVVTGTPAAASATSSYTITASNIAGSTTVSVDITVISAPSGLSYAQNPASYPVGVAITQNLPTVTGTVSTWSVTPALPTGLAFNTSSGAITGTPTVASAAANYTVTASNLAGNATVGINISVVTAPTGLSYLQNPALYGVGTAITPNTPSVIGTITNYVIAPALPAGISINATTGIISGTPTVAATTADYVVTGSNAAGLVRDTLSITVLSAPTLLTYNPNPAVYGVGVAIAANSPTVNAAVQSFSVSPSLPAGLIFNTTSGTISGTASAPSAAANYTITAQNAAGSTTALLNLTVLAPPGPLTYSQSPAVYGMGTAITPNTPTVSGTITNWSVSPTLPAGLLFNAGTGIITGTPTVATATQTYTVTAQNVAGAVTFPLSITVLAAPSNLQYSANPAVYAVDAAIAPNTPALVGSATGYSISPALPSGLAFSGSSGNITGTPTAASPAQNYTVTAQNAAGSTTVSLNITVLAAPSGLSYTEDTVIYTAGAAITQNRPSVTGTVARYTVNPTLPAGLILDSLTGILSGTPTAAATAANYTVTASNAAGNSTFILRITVLSVPTGLTYSQNPASYGVGAPITPNVPSVNGIVSSYSIDSTTPLPAGLVLDTLTGVISGTPSVETAARSYTVRATNFSGSATVSLNLTVLSAPSNFAYAQNPALYGVGTAITPNIPTVTGTVTSYSVTPALPAGLILNAATGIISGTPTSESASGYLITARNAAGSVTVNLTVTVLAPTSNFSYSDNPAIYTVGLAITPNNPSINGTPIGYSISPALPSGLVLSSTTGIITGTPMAQSTALSYTVTAQNAAGPPTTTTLSIAVNSLSSTFTYPQMPFIFALDAAIPTLSPTITGAVQFFSVSPSLPAGLSLNASTGEITGIPTIAVAAQNYSVTGTNASGSSSVTLSIAVVAAPMRLSYAQNPVTYPLNATIAANIPTVTGIVSGYSIAPPLPPGLNLNPTTGVISGTPTDTASVRNYLITAQNIAGQTSVTLNLRILAPPSGLTYAQNQATYRVGTPIPQNAPIVAGSALTFTIDNPLPAGLALDSVTGIISGTPLSATAATTYTITATNISGSTQTTITLTVDIAIAIRPGSGINSFSLNSGGLRLAQVGLPAGARWAKVEMSSLSGRSLGIRLHNLGNGNTMEWGTDALPQGLMLVKISLLDENRKALSASLLKIPRLR